MSKTPRARSLGAARSEQGENELVSRVRGLFQNLGVLKLNRIAVGFAQAGVTVYLSVQLKGARAVPACSFRSPG